MPAAGDRLPTVDVLRGIAALAVTWYHFTTANSALPGPGLIRWTGEGGWIGVDVFFVISGFIIPYALHRGGYRLADYGRFLLKRIVRLDPPYLASIVVILVGLAVAARVPGLPPQPSVSVTSVLLHLGYLNAFFDYPWLNIVFWTLAIEFQFYLVAGLVYPLLARRDSLTRMAVFAGAAALASFSQDEATVPHWIMIFCSGALVFQFRAGSIGRPGLIGWLAAAAVVTTFTHDLQVALVVAVTSLLIAFVEVRVIAPLGWLGQVSYSLYLVHPIVGGRIMALGARAPHGTSATVLFLGAALAATLTAAWALYVTVERPAQRWSSRIRYRTAAP